MLTGKLCSTLDLNGEGHGFCKICINEEKVVFVRLLNSMLFLNKALPL